MIGRRAVLVSALIAGLLWAVSGGIVLALTPPQRLAVYLAHYPVATRLYLINWLAAPVGDTVFLLFLLGYAFFYRRKTPPADDKRWMDIVVIGMGVLSIVVEIVHLGGLIADHMQRAAFLAAGGAPRAYRFDQRFIMTRILMACSGLFIIWMGNRLPKLMKGFHDKPRAQQAWIAQRQFGGWLFVIAGIAFVACAFVTPFLRAELIATAIWIASLLGWGLAWLVFRYGPPPAETASSL